jgi:adenylate kinase family enzyme
MRIAIIGNSGSGKSTLARSLARLHGLASLDLDTVAWEPGQIAVAREPALAAADLAAFCTGHPHWVVEGCYAGLIQASLAYQPILLFLEPGIAACVAHCRSRPWEPHKYRSQAEQDERLEGLLEWVRAYDARDDDCSQRAHQAVFDAYPDVKQQFLQPCSAADMDLASLTLSPALAA